MKTFAFALVLCSLSVTARAADVGYVDVYAAIENSQEGKKAQAEADGIVAARTPEYQAAQAALSAAKPADKKAAQDKLNALGQQIKQAQMDRLTQTSDSLIQRVNRVLPKMSEAHKQPIQAISVPINGKLVTLVLAVPAKMNLTAELLRRLDAGEGKTEEDLKAELQKKYNDALAENAKLKAEKAELTKPVAASPSSPPPIQPKPPTVASKGK